ncbi:MAG: HigA family addiction module antitoxin [Chloroflexi bacterium]|nr:HigA family addiction module antitoxin [Chloroflexota bacterium]
MTFRRVVHPGDILKDELAEIGITLTAFARDIDVPPNRVSQIIAGKRSITGDTALRFGHWFGVEPQFWLNLQSQYDLALAERETGEKVRALPTAAGR